MWSATFLHPGKKKSEPWVSYHQTLHTLALSLFIGVIVVFLTLSQKDTLEFHLPPCLLHSKCDHYTVDSLHTLSPSVLNFPSQIASPLGRQPLSLSQSILLSRTSLLPK